MIDVYLDDLPGAFTQASSTTRACVLDPVDLPGSSADPPEERPGHADGLGEPPRRPAEGAPHRRARRACPLVVTENGIATGDDARRVAYLESHLGAVLAALAAGIDVRGYLYSSSFDNFEWAEGYRPQFGLVGIDRENDLRREVRPWRTTASSCE